MVHKLLTQFTKRLQHLRKQEQQSTDEEQQNANLVEFLGTAYVALNQVQLIQHELWSKSETFKEVQGTDENFLLRDEVV